MVELANMKAPGWQRVVHELTQPAPDDRVFLMRILAVLGQVASARQAVLYALGTAQGTNNESPAGPEPTPVVVWPWMGDVIDAQGRLTMPVEQLMDPSRVQPNDLDRRQDVLAAARACANARTAMVFGGEDAGDTYYAGGNEDASGRAKLFVIAVPIMLGLPAEAPSLPLRAVVTLLVESRSRQAVQTTMALVEILAGYVFTHAAQQSLRRTKGATAALELAARLIASINSTQDFKGCALQLVNDLCRQLACDRIALGWVKGSPAKREKKGEPVVVGGRRTIELIALSDTENIDRRMMMNRKLEAAMEECLDQEQPVVYPAPPSSGGGSDAVLSHAITHAHRELAASDAKLRVASFPLRVSVHDGSRMVGVLLVETATPDARLDLGTIELVLATLDLLSPILAVRYSDDRPLHLRAVDSGVKALAWAVGPRHTAWKAAGVAAMIATGVLFFGHTTYRVSAPFELAAKEKRTLSAPFNGIVARVMPGIESGARVTAGQPLMEFDKRELVLQALDADAQLTQHEKQADDSLRKGELAEAQQSKAKADQARARRDLANLNIERSRVVSPIAGVILAGDVKEKVGSTIKLGDPVFEVADTTEMIVKAKVDDRDIAFIKVGQTGEIAPKARPGLKVPMEVVQIVPLSQAVEGQNAFEVRCRLTEPVTRSLADGVTQDIAAAGTHEWSEWFRPGLEGQAKFNTESRSFAWIASRRIVDQLKVWLWW